MVLVLSEKLVGEVTYAEIIAGIVIALVLVSLWQRAIENWLFETLGINRKSTFQTLIVAIAFTIAFFIFLNIVTSVSRDVILGVSKTTAALTQTGATLGDSRESLRTVNAVNVTESNECEEESNDYSSLKEGEDVVLRRI